LYRDELKSVYHGKNGLRTLRELARTYLTRLNRQEKSSTVRM